MNKKPLMTVGCEEIDDSDNENQSQYMKDDVVYNRPENIVMVRSQGNKIVVVCKDEDMKWILTFKVTDDYEQLPEKN